MRERGRRGDFIEPELAPAPVDAGAAVAGGEGGIPDILSKEQFFNQNQITLQNPYGSQGFFTRLFGRNPSSIDYSNQLDEQTRRQIMDLAYDRYRNPYAKVNILGDEVFGYKETGEVRYGLASLGSSPTTFLGDVVKVPLPKSSQRSVAELIPGLGGIARILPQETMKMIEADSLPGGIPTAAQGRAKYEASKREGSFLENIIAALSGDSDERR